MGGREGGRRGAPYIPPQKTSKRLHKTKHVSITLNNNNHEVSHTGRCMVV
jgi:hypothetical protein